MAPENKKYAIVVSTGANGRIVYTIKNGTVYMDDIQDCRQDDDKSLIIEK